MNKVKICHLTSVHSIFDDRIFIKECVGLAEKGFSVTLIACGNEFFEETRDKVRLISLNIPVKNRLQRFVKRSKAIYHRAIQEDADIYHFHDPELLPIGLKLKRRGKKVIYDIHEDVPRQILQKDWIPVFMKPAVSRIFERIENYYVKHLNAVVVVTAHIAKRFLRISPKVIICANYASLKEFETIAEWGDRRENICYLGSISRLRGIVEVVNASKKSNVQLELAGEFESKMLEDKIISESLVNFKGYLDRKSVRSVLSSCFAGTVTFLPAPNHNNACPNKMFEYMASGIPVIASDFEDWKPIVEGNNAGICVEPTNVDSISNAILLLKNNPQMARQMGLNGRKAFEEKYNWQIEERKLIALYKDL